MASEPFVIERVYDAPVKAVWKAITDAQAIKQWFMQFEKFELRVGCEFQFTAEHKGFTYIHHCRVMEVVPEQRLAYSWQYEGYEGDSIVTFEVFPEGNKTRIKLTHDGLGTFPKLPSFARENFVKGWTSLIGDSLKAHVERKGAE